MSKIKIKLNENHLKLINEFRVEKIDDYHSGIDTVNPYGGTYLMEDLAQILGYWDKALPGTESDYDGRKFGIENEIDMLKTHMYLMDNAEYILSIILQFALTGVKIGTYTSSDTYIKWTYSE